MEVLALKRVVSLQLQQILEQEHVTKTELALRMKTSRRARPEGGTALRACLMLIRER